MKKRIRPLDTFFLELDRLLDTPAEVILTGAAAGSLMGHVRPSLDIDFEIRLKGRGKRGTDLLEKAIKQSAEKTGVAANYSEDISHWSMINYLDYRKQALPYKRIGRIRVKVISPEHWTIGKLARFLEIDISDLLKVIKKQKISPRRLIPLWARALHASPLSLEKGRFRDNVIHFLKRHGRKLWGKLFNVERSINDFKRISKTPSIG